MTPEEIGDLAQRYFYQQERAEKLGGYIADYQRQKRDADDEAEGLRAQIAEAVADGGHAELQVPGVCIINYRKPPPPSAVITDEAALPAEFIIETTTAKPDKKAIRNALAAGGHVPGAMLSNAKPSVAIKELVNG